MRHYGVLVSGHHETGTGELIFLEDLLHVGRHAVDYISMLVVHFLDVFCNVRIFNDNSLGAPQHVVVEN